MQLIVVQVSPSLSVSSNSSGRKGKVGITIKKSPVDSTGGERGTKFETSLLGGSSSEVRKEGRKLMKRQISHSSGQQVPNLTNKNLQF